MAQRFRPLPSGTKVTSPYGPRAGGFHGGTDYGKDGGSAGLSVYACQAGTVIFAGAASGYGGPDPAGWLVIDSDDSEGAGCAEYGHIIREVPLGAKVRAGQRIGRINPDSRTNGGVAPHLHLTVWQRAYGGVRVNPEEWLRGCPHPNTVPAPAPAPVSGGTVNVPNPVTRQQISPNRHSGGRDVDWIVIHTQEGAGTARSITDYLCRPAAQVSYNAVCDDRETVLVVPWDQNPWSAMNANTRGDHILMAGSFASWSRDKWLSPDARDGKNEDLQLTRTAALVAWRCAVRDIPIRYVGGRGMPKSPGVCGHVDFGQWGGGHTDPGPNFPWGELISRAISIYNGGKDWLAMATMAEVEALIYKCLKVYVGPIGSDVKDIRQQLTGGRDAGQYGGFEQGGNRTLYDLTAAVAAETGVAGTRDTLETKEK